MRIIRAVTWATGLVGTYGVDPSAKVVALDRVASAERAEVGG